MFLRSDYKAGILQNASGGSTEFERDIIVAKYRNGATKDFKIGFEPTKMMFVNYREEKIEYVEEMKDVGIF